MGKLKKKVQCSIVGARGYAGLEIARLLLRHPQADLVRCYATSSFELTPFIKAAGSVTCLNDSEIESDASEVVFLATPAEVSLKLAPRLLARGQNVIDLSGAFRLKKNDYEKWYGFTHTEEKWLQEAQYGLVPFVGPEATSLIANPGCFATAISMALIPLIRGQLIDANSLVIDAKSGTTGAGKKAAENLLFSEVDGECLPYKVGQHQHYPEISEAIASFAGEAIDAHMTTSLLSARRGIIAGIYANLKKGVEVDDVTQAFHEAYSAYPLVSFGATDRNADLLKLRGVVGTARTHLSYHVDGHKLYLFSCIDNLMKGAASQAVENLNRLQSLPSWTGLEELEALL